MGDLEPYEEGRQCSSHLESPPLREGREEARNYVSLIRAHNGGDNVVFRSCYLEHDILRHVFRWSADLTPEHVFQNGFRSDDQETRIPRTNAGERTPDEIYYNLETYVNHAGQPMTPHNDNYVFVSTTYDSDYTPQTMAYANQVAYRYEIYAPGGILVGLTLGEHANYNQHEVAFVRGIHRRFIRSAQRFTLQLRGPHVGRERAGTSLLFNPHFNPAPCPERFLRIQRPVDYYYLQVDGVRRRQPLEIVYTLPPNVQYMRRRKRDVSKDNAAPDTEDWYVLDIADVKNYITSTFRSSNSYEAYLFMGLEYVVVDYAPGTKDDMIISGPLLISEGFTSLKGTPFGEYGVDASFASLDQDEAYIFCDNICARVNYAPKRSDDKMIEGPMTISDMFPFFKDTEFRDGVDAAFDCQNKYEAYIFKGNNYALINYKERYLIGGPKLITDGFYSWKNTIFETGIDAAFTPHVCRYEAYIFKGDQYALINYAPGTTNDFIIGGPKSIKDNWPSLDPILPCLNDGPDARMTL